jgi:5-methylcytosine-specific restriction protein A
MTGFSPKVRALILERDGGCVICGRSYGALQIHHRAPRGMGGSKAAWVNQAPNGITLCDEHHRWVEANRTEAEAAGWIVRRGVTLPANVPVQYLGGLRWLLPDGRTEPITYPLF